MPARRQIKVNIVIDEDPRNERAAWVILEAPKSS